MTDHTTMQTKPVQKQKSKRLSSFIWIVVMWAALRLVAELNPISWERGFWRGAFFLLAYPTFFLLLSIAMRSFKLQKLLRWSAFSMFFGTLIAGYTEQSRGGPFFWIYELYIAQALFFLLMVGVALYRWRDGGIQKGDANV